MNPLISIKVEDRKHPLQELKERRAKEKSIRAKRNQRFVRNYGVSLDDYEAQYAAQAGMCSICGQLNETLHIDHNHQSGDVRGLLCHNCNTAIGQLNDDEDRLLAAIMYLRNPPGINGCGAKNTQIDFKGLL